MEGRRGEVSLSGLFETSGTVTSETESNNTQATADGPIKAESDFFTAYTASLDGADTDWQYVEILGDGTMNYRISTYTAPVGVYNIDMYDALGNVVYQTGGSLPLTGSLPVQAGKLYIKISSNNSTNGETYHLQLWGTLDSDQHQSRFYITDHLGSTRAVVLDNGDHLASYDYYPFGLEMPGRSSSSGNTEDNYKFTGFEDDTEAGIEIYYAGARGYDPALGRFLQIDNYHYKYPSLSTYQYAANNPINFIDVNGDSIRVTGTQDEVLDILFSISSACECKVTASSVYDSENDEYTTTITGSDIDTENWDNLTMQQKIITSSIGSPNDVFFKFVDNSEVARYGGAKTGPNTEGDIEISLARGFHDGNWEGLEFNRAPFYTYADRSRPDPNSKLAWWLTGKSETYSASGFRNYGLNETVAHEIIHINDYMLGHVSNFSRRTLENNAIDLTNKWRRRHGIPPRRK